MTEKLSKKESEIFSYILKGMTYSEIAEKTSNSVSTIKSHAAAIRAKLGYHSTASLLSAYRKDALETARRDVLSCKFKMAQEDLALSAMQSLFLSTYIAHTDLSKVQAILGLSYAKMEACVNSLKKKFGASTFSEVLVKYFSKLAPTISSGAIAYAQDIIYEQEGTL